MTAARRFLLALLVGLAVVGVFRLRIDVDILNLLPSDLPVAAGLAEYQEKFLQAGELIIVLQSQDAAITLSAVTAIVSEVRAHTNLIDRVFWQPPANESLADAAQFLSYLWLNAPTGEVLQLRDALRPQNLPDLLAESRERIATSFNPTDLFLRPRDPLNLSSVSSAANESFETPERFFSSPDGLTRLVYLYSAVPLANYEQCRTWVRQVRRLLQSALDRENLSAKVNVLLTGRPVFVDEISSGMRSDMSTAVPGTLFLIGVLFYLLHREWISLLLLLVTLFFIMVWTALAGSAVLGQLNVVSLGFASILLGLAEDFGIVLHQELKTHPGADAPTIRKIAGPGIFWSAVTTASAFALLNLSTLPGLRHLGTLVALGIVIGALTMLHLFLPLMIRYRRRASASDVRDFPAPSRPTRHPVALSITFLALLLTIATFAVQPPRFDPSPDVLRPRQSEASAALHLVQETLGTSGDPFWLLIHGNSAAEVRRDLEKLETHFASNSASLGIDSFTLPLSIWPDPTNQNANLPVLREVAADRSRIFTEVLTNGFTPEAFDLSTTIFAQWESASPTAINWPEGRVAEWILPKFVSRTETNLLALGLLVPTTNFTGRGVIPPKLSDRVLLSGWSLLGKTVLEQVKREVPVISAFVCLAVICALWLTFRRLKPVLLSLAVLSFSGAILLALMGVFGWRWNLINLVALPLLLGMGIDYSIHMQTTLARFKGDTASTFHTVGRALLLAGSTTIIGFGFLGLSSNSGMASLGRVCALGLTILLITSVFLLPAWARPKLCAPPRPLQ